MEISPYDSWAEIYDSVFSYVVDDIPFYVEEATRSGGAVLELGCGTGRVSIPIARAGIDIVGIDASSAMLARAREKSREAGIPNLKLLWDDMRDFNLSSEFNLIIIPFRGLLSLLSVDDEIRTLTNIKRHLAPGGKLIFDIFAPDLNMMVQEGDVPYHFGDVTDTETGKRLVVWNQANYDAFSQVMSIRTTIEQLDDSGRVSSKMYRDFALRYIFRWEMHHLLGLCGYNVRAMYGNFERGEFREDSTEMVWVASPQV